MVLGLCCAAVGACGDDTSDGDHNDGDHEHGDHGDDLVEACQEITEACHEVDTGSGEISDCHLTAHNNDEADCLEAQEHCLPLCAAAATDGGGHDEDAATDYAEE